MERRVRVRAGMDGGRDRRHVAARAVVEAHHAARGECREGDFTKNSFGLCHCSRTVGLSRSTRFTGPIGTRGFCVSKFQSRAGLRNLHISTSRHVLRQAREHSGLKYGDGAGERVESATR